MNLDEGAGPLRRQTVPPYRAKVSVTRTIDSSGGITDWPEVALLDLCTPLEERMA